VNLAQAYKQERAPRVFSHRGPYQERASHALRTARIKLAWEAADGVELSEWEAERSDDPPFSGRVRLLLRNDDDWSSALDFDGSERDHKEAAERAEREGVCGVCAQFWNGAEWEEVDSVWGFIGNDWRRSGYDVDLMSSALDALTEHDATQARQLEATRPDLYPESSQ
jgi:hypothetical protein